MNIPNWEKAIKTVKNTLSENPDLIAKANALGQKYQNQRGLMIVDCVASRQRRYDSYVVPKLIPLYVSKAEDLSIQSLAKKAPSWMPLRDGEARTMKQVAQVLLKYGENSSVTDENKLCTKWASDELAHNEILEIKGIGPALLQYLRMLSGANTLKVDVRIIEELRKLALPVEWFTSDGLLKLCADLAREAGCTMVELDQVLWHTNSTRT